jgi:hypothetical protein
LSDYSTNKKSREDSLLEAIDVLNGKKQSLTLLTTKLQSSLKKSKEERLKIPLISLTPAQLKELNAKNEAVFPTTVTLKPIEAFDASVFDTVKVSALEKVQGEPYVLERDAFELIGPAGTVASPDGK